MMCSHEIPRTSDYIAADSQALQTKQKQSKRGPEARTMKGLKERDRGPGGGR